jgi:hypothetical protein
MKTLLTLIFIAAGSIAFAADKCPISGKDAKPSSKPRIGNQLFSSFPSETGIPGSAFSFL